MKTFDLTSSNSCQPDFYYDILINGCCKKANVCPGSGESIIPFDHNLPQLCPSFFIPNYALGGCCHVGDALLRVACIGFNSSSPSAYDKNMLTKCPLFAVYISSINGCCPTTCPDGSPIVYFADWLPQRCYHGWVPNDIVGGCCKSPISCSSYPFPSYLYQRAQNGQIQSSIYFDSKYPNYCPVGYMYIDDINSCCGPFKCPVTGIEGQLPMVTGLSGVICTSIQTSQVSWMYTPSINTCCPVCPFSKNLPKGSCTENLHCWVKYGYNYNCHISGSCCNDEEIDPVHGWE